MNNADTLPRGLPDRLPAGEVILWQGSPGWRAFACRALHVKAVAGYFSLMLAWRMASDLYDGTAAATMAAASLRFTAFAAVALGILLFIGWLAARTSIYTITNRRIVMRIGIALPITFNIPFGAIQTVRMARASGGGGDLAFLLGDQCRIAYLHLMPHARPWHLARPEPMLRAIADVELVADVLARAMTVGADQDSIETTMTAVPSARTPASHALQSRLGHATEESPA